MNLSPVTLERERVRLEPLSLEHHAGLREVGLDPELWRWATVHVRSPDDMRTYIEKALDDQRQGRSLPFATIERATGRVVGSTRFGNFDAANRRVEIGWTWIARAHQGTGLNVEAKLLMLRHAFEVLRCIRVELKTDALNERSRRAILALGAKEEGTLRRHMIVAGGRIRDTVYYSILDSEWLSVQARLATRLARLRRCLSHIRVVATLVLLAVVQPGHGAVSRHDFTVVSEPGISIFVREVRSEAEDAPVRMPPVILLHGARVPGVASFDLPVEGGSLAADIAEASHRTFIMDARGYGGSTRPEAMNEPPGSMPLVKSHEVVRDVHAVVQSVKQRTGATQVALLGWATGGHWAGMYASLYPEQVSHLIMLNSLYGGSDRHSLLGHGTSAEMPGQPGRFNAAEVGGYRYNTAASLVSQWDRSIPLEDKALWRDPRIVEAYQRAALASDPTSTQRDPPSFRAPNGAIEDSFYLATGRQLWDAASITARVLIVRSEIDFWSRPEDVTTLQRHLVRAAEVRVLHIPEATHFVHLDRPERGRATLLKHVKSFLDAS